jgi:hypothetical protein
MQMPEEDTYMFNSSAKLLMKKNNPSMISHHIFCRNIIEKPTDAVLNAILKY